MHILQHKSFILDYFRIEAITSRLPAFSHVFSFQSSGLCDSWTRTHKERLDNNNKHKLYILILELTYLY